MAELPSGTTTLLFSDIEGSTRLLRKLGPDRYREILTDHRSLLRELFTLHEGTEVDVEGDAFFVAFRRARDGVAAAAAAQWALASHPWPDDEEVCVRIGLHTGEPTLANDTYVGLDVHRTARIAAAAHGGQVLLSATTRDLLGGELPDGVSLRDLGEHRLRDLTEPQRLYQLVLDGSPAKFPPLKTLENRPTNLPPASTPLVGRDRELMEVITLLHPEQTRLLTLTGPGGTGKTRLALQVATELLDQFPDGVYSVPLAQLNEPGLVLPSIARTLAIKESGGQPLAEVLEDSLREKKLLLLLDNFEHVLGSALLVSQLLAAAPQLQVLVTSRSPLRLSGECEYQVPPLALPDPRRLPSLETLRQHAAVALFTQRAQAVRPGFEVTSENAATIAEICVRLDGLPLTIELAAARVRILPPEALLRRLEQRLQILTGGPRDLPSRQQTLRGAIDWSYRLLGHAEQRLFARLAVFVDGCTLEAAEAVCDTDREVDADIFDGVSSLVEQAMLRHEWGPEGESRFSMLETVREYALERLEDSEEPDEVRRRHAEYFGTLSEHAAKELLGRAQRLWLSRLEAEHGNLRAALAWSEEAGAIELRLRMAGALSYFWRAHGYLSEGRGWLEQALGSRSAQPPRERADALLAAGSLIANQGDWGALTTVAEEGLALCRELGDLLGMARTLDYLAMAAARQEGNVDRARRYQEESVALTRRSGDKWYLAVMLNNLGYLDFSEGHAEQGIEAWQEAIALCREVENPELTATLLNNLALAALAQKRAGDAESLLRESLSLSCEVGSKVATSYALEGLAAVAISRQRPERAARLLGAANTLREDMGVSLDVFEEQLHERNVASAQEELGKPGFAVAHGEGREMLPEQAVGYALDRAQAASPSDDSSRA